MINFNCETTFKLEDRASYLKWITLACSSEGFKIAELNYIFCDDAYLLDINQTYLQHDDYTDIITFDYTTGTTVSGDVYISIERVKENAGLFDVPFENELQRVMAHGVLHLMGYKDKSEIQTAQMRAKEEEKIKMFHVEQ